jgi:hypothetical protein
MSEAITQPHAKKDPEQSPTFSATQTPANKTGSPKTTTTVGSYGGSSWRTRPDRIRTVELVAQVTVRQIGRNRQWHIEVGSLKRLATKLTFVIPNDEVKIAQ